MDLLSIATDAGAAGALAKLSVDISRAAWPGMSDRTKVLLAVAWSFVWALLFYTGQHGWHAFPGALVFVLINTATAAGFAIGLTEGHKLPRRIEARDA